MPKNPKNPNYPPIRSIRNIAYEGGGVDLVPRAPLLFSLSNLNREIVNGLNVGDPVLIRLDQSPIMVTTSVGVPIGQVRHEDVASVLQKGSRRGKIYLAEPDPLRCVVEVP